MTATEKVEEVAKLRKYLDGAEAVVAKIGIFGRRPVFNKFDVIAMALVSKTFSVARACLLLIDNGFDDEAYGCLFSLTGLDEEALTDLELEARVRQVEGALRGLPEGSCLYGDFNFSDSRKERDAAELRMAWEHSLSAS